VGTGIYKFGNNTYPWRVRRRSNLGYIFRGKKCILWAGKYGTLHEDLCTCMIISCSVLLRKRNVSDKSYRENQNTHFM